MLYSQEQVKNFVPFTKENLTLARKHSPFKLNSKLKNKIFNQNLSKHPLNLLEDLTSIVGEKVDYDYPHCFEGTRNAKQTLTDKKGHCIEQNFLLKTLCDITGLNTRLIIVKQPFGYTDYTHHTLNVHPFVFLDYAGKTFFADAVNGKGEVKQYNAQLGVIQTEFNFIEAVSFYLYDAGEDLGLAHDKYLQSRKILNLALKVNPNNYSVLTTLADVYVNAWIDKGQNSDWHLLRAEKCFERAKKIAPESFSVFKEYGDFCLKVYENVEVAVNAYKQALEKRIDDLRCLESLIYRFYEIGECKSGEISKDLFYRKLRT